MAAANQLALPILFLPNLLPMAKIVGEQVVFGFEDSKGRKAQMEDNSGNGISCFEFNKKANLGYVFHFQEADYSLL